MIVDNLELIKPILDYGEQEDFYFIQVMQRLKDIGDTTSRQTKVIKEYYVRNEEYLERKYAEIQKLAEFYHARVYINLNLIESRKLGFAILKDLSVRLASDSNSSKYTNIVAKGIAQCAVKDKRWIVDIDDLSEYEKIKQIIIESPPHYQDNILIELPTVNGKHLITTSFNPTEIYKHYPQDILRKNNPTLLYYNSDQNAKDVTV